MGIILFILITKKESSNGTLLNSYEAELMESLKNTEEYDSIAMRLRPELTEKKYFKKE